MNHGGGDDQDDTLSAAAREAVDRARRRVREESPTPDDLAGLAIAASDTADIPRVQIRCLAAEAIANLQQVNYLLGRLVELAGEEREP